MGSDSWFPKLNSCCGFPLRTGTLIIGWTFAAIGVLDFPIGLPNTIKFISGYHSIESTGEQIAVVIMIKEFILGALGTIAALMLLFGVYKQKPTFLSPFIASAIIEGIDLLLNFPMFIFTNLRGDMERMLPIKNHDQDIYEAVYHPLSLILNFALNFYICTIVYSYYKEMRSSIPYRRSVDEPNAEIA
nr:PREDICTED: uncharacterized protein LOC109040404 [Bemisia tabaci]